MSDKQTNEPRTKKYYTAKLNLKEIKFETAAHRQRKVVAKHHTKWCIFTRTSTEVKKRCVCGLTPLQLPGPDAPVETRAQRAKKEKQRFAFNRKSMSMQMSVQ